MSKSSKAKKSKVFENKKDTRSIPTKFWDHYEKKGQVFATLWLLQEFKSDLMELRKVIPYIVEEGNKRGHDLIKLIEELNAPRTNNGGSELHADSSNEADQSEDEDVSTSARDADGESRDRSKEAEVGS